MLNSKRSFKMLSLQHNRNSAVFFFRLEAALAMCRPNCTLIIIHKTQLGSIHIALKISKCNDQDSTVTIS